MTSLQILYVHSRVVYCHTKCRNVYYDCLTQLHKPQLVCVLGPESIHTFYIGEKTMLNEYKNFRNHVISASTENNWEETCVAV